MTRQQADIPPRTFHTSASSAGVAPHHASYPPTKRGGDVAAVGDILVCSALPGTLAGLTPSPSLRVGYVLAYQPETYGHSYDQKLNWIKIKIATYDVFHDGQAIHVHGCDFGFFKTTTNVLENVPTVFVRNPYRVLHRPPDTAFTLIVQAVASSDPEPVPDLMSVGLGQNLEFDFTIVPKSGSRHSFEQEFEVDVLIYQKRVQRSGTDHVYFTHGNNAHVAGPLIDIADSPVTIIASHFTPTPISPSGGVETTSVPFISPLGMDKASPLRVRQRVGTSKHVVCLATSQS